MIQLCKVIRKTLDWTNQSSAVVTLLTQTAADRAIDFDIALQNLETTNLKMFEVEMLQEMAETLLVCPSTFYEGMLKTSFENHLYYLLGCGVEAL